MKKYIYLELIYLFLFLLLLFNWQWSSSLAANHSETFFKVYEITVLRYVRLKEMDSWISWAKGNKFNPTDYSQYLSEATFLNEFQKGVAQTKNNGLAELKILILEFEL